MKIETDKVVSLRFVMRNEAGEVMEDIMEQAPVQYLHGAGNILPSLENGVEGLQAGESKHLDLMMGSGESYSIDVVIDGIRSATPEELIEGKPEEKQPDGVCGQDCCC